MFCQLCFFKLHVVATNAAMSTPPGGNGSDTADPKRPEELMTVAVGSLGCDLVLCKLLCESRKSRIRTCACVSTGVVVLAVVTLTITLWLKLSEPTLPCYFSPGDSRLISYSPYFCESITLETSSRTVSASIYLVKETPPLIQSGSFVVEDSYDLPGREYGYVNYFLHLNSTSSVFACSPMVSSYPQFHIVRGKSGFQDWMRLPRWNSNSTVFYRLGFSCGILTPSPYRATESNEYYFAFYNSGTRQLQINIRMTISPYQYSLDNLTNLPNCSTENHDNRCTVDVPFNYFNALIVTDIPESVNWKDRIDLSWTCNPRGMAIVVLVMAAAVITLMVSAPLLVVVGYHFYRHRKTRGGLRSHLKKDSSATGMDPIACNQNHDTCRKNHFQCT